MRGIAALLTVIFHVDILIGGGNLLVKHNQSMVLNRMYLMVDFFFILSGFIMCHVYGKIFKNKVDKPTFKKFIAARFARVYPLHILMLVYCLALFFVSAQLGIPKITVLQADNNSYSIITNLLLLHSMNFNSWFTWNHASWSISTEWWAYMIFPFLVMPFQRLRSSGKVVIAFFCFAGYICISFFIVPLVTVPKGLSFAKIPESLLSVNVAYQYGFIRCLCGFLLGMVMYDAYKLNWLKNLLSNGYILCILFIAALTCMHFSLPDFITIIFFPFILLSGAFGSSGMNKFFRTRPLQKLGDWSFSIYLTHQPLLFTISSIVRYFNPEWQATTSILPIPNLKMSTGWLLCLALIILVIFISYLTYTFFEVPVRNSINKRFKHYKIIYDLPAAKKSIAANEVE